MTESAPFLPHETDMAEAIAAAADALKTVAGEDLHMPQPHHFERRAQTALTAAMPFIRMKIAGEVSRYDPVEAALAGEYAPRDIARWLLAQDVAVPDMQE